MYRIILILTLSFFPVINHLKTFANPEKGMLDLHDWDGHEIIKLEGEWLFYPSKLLESGTAGMDADSARLVVSVPSYWTSYRINGERPEGKGWGTYSLQIILPTVYPEKLAFLIPVFDDSYRFFINGQKIAENGFTSSDPLVEKPGYNPQVVVYTPDSSQLELMIQVSNFNHRRGGFWKVMRMGDPEQVLKQKAKYESVIFLSMGIIGAFSLLFLFFFIFYRKNLASLFFSITLAGVLLRIMVTDTFPCNLFCNLPWEWLIRLEYLGTFIAFGFILWYFHFLYPLRWMKKICLLNSVLTGLLVILLFFSEVSVFSWSMFYFKPVAIVLFSFYLGLSAWYALKKKKIYLVYFFSLLVSSFAVVNDILVSGSQKSFAPGYIVLFGTLFFVSAHAILLVSTWVQAYRDKIRLNLEVEYMNLNLENLVKERMAEVEAVKQEVQKQNLEIAAKNSELERMLSFTTRIQSIISHDLKSPITSLFQISDYLSQNNSKSEFRETFRSIRDLSESANHLIDNLLYWSRGQQGEIRVNLQKNNLLIMVREVCGLYTEGLKQKAISLDILMKEDTWAMCDPVLTRIVLRNLISNALKFTPRSGRISITAAKPVESEFVVVLIEDNGKGIQPEILQILNENNSERVITPAYGTANEPGSGLGIKLCHELLRLNKGKLKIDSEQGRGTRVMVFLPAILLQ